MIKIYTDGGCAGNPGPGGWAFVIVEEAARKAVVLKEKWGAEADTTNNRMEVSAAIAALETFKRLKLGNKAAVLTDSQYVQKGMTEWIETWKENGWRNHERAPVKNQDLWERLDALAGRFHLTWTWIKGHAGNRFNERCDELTQRAISALVDE
jgi:ribonuclease HI